MGTEGTRLDSARLVEPSTSSALAPLDSHMGGVGIEPTVSAM